VLYSILIFIEKLQCSWNFFQTPIIDHGRYIKIQPNTSVRGCLLDCKLHQTFTFYELWKIAFVNYAEENCRRLLNFQNRCSKILRSNPKTCFLFLSIVGLHSVLVKQRFGDKIAPSSKSDICDKKPFSWPIVCKIKYLMIQIRIGCVKQLNVV